MNQLTVIDVSQSHGLETAIATHVVNQLVATGAISRRPALSGFTLKAFFNQYIETHAKPHCATWKDMERSFKNYFQRFADLDLYEVQRSEVRQWHAELGERNGKHTANRALELMVMLYNKAYEWDLIMQFNPGSRIKKYKLQSRDRFLQPEELPRFFAALETLRYPVTRDLFLMCLFTGARLGNVRSMRWDQVDLVLRIWRIPKTKNGTSQILPLTTEAVSILQNRKRHNKTPWVFANLGGNGHIKYVDLAWRQMIARAGIKDLRIHDLRRSLASWQALTGASTVAIAATLNHKSFESTEVYARLNTAAVRGAIKTATQAMLESAGFFVDAEPSDATTTSSNPKPFNQKEKEPWVTESEVEQILNVPANRLRILRTRNDGPPYLKKGYAVLYKLSMVRQWIAQRPTTCGE